MHLGRDDSAKIRVVVSGHVCGNEQDWQFAKSGIDALYLSQEAYAARSSSSLFVGSRTLYTLRIRAQSLELHML